MIRAIKKLFRNTFGNAIISWCDDIRKDVKKAQYRLAEIEKLRKSLEKINGMIQKDLSISELQRINHENSLVKGWWDKPVSVGDFIANAHAELSEAFEEYKKGGDLQKIYFSLDKENQQKPEGIPIELGDVVLRILDFCGKHKINLQEAIIIKMIYNANRPYRHGNKVA